MNGGDQQPILDRCINYSLPLLPILQTYGWGKFNFSLILIVLLITWYTFKQFPYRIKTPFYLNIYLWYYLISFLLGCLITGILEFPSGWALLFVSYTFFFSTFNKDLLVKAYTKIAYIAIAFLYLQVIVATTTGIKIPGIFEFLPISLSDETYLERINFENWRSCSFFSEAALCAQFLMPILVLSIFRHKFLTSIIITGAFLLLRSGNGLFILASTVTFFMIYNIFTKINLKKILYFITGCIVVSGCIMLYLNTEDADHLMERQDELTESNYRSSGFFRIYRGYYVFDAMTPMEKTFGANNPILMSNAEYRSSLYFLFGEKDYYFNSVQNIIIKTGIIGAILFLIFLINLYRETDIAGKSMTCTFVMLSFIASMYFNNVMLLYLLIIYSRKKDMVV